MAETIRGAGWSHFDGISHQDAGFKHESQGRLRGHSSISLASAVPGVNRRSFSCMMRIQVFDETLPAREGAAAAAVAPLVLEAGEAIVTLRDLIRSRVRQEVERYNRHPVEVFEGLVQPEESERILNGFRIHGPQKVLDWDAQFQVACSSFERNGFLVLVDEEQVTDLDAPLPLREDSRVSFVKLTPLIGG